MSGKGHRFELDLKNAINEVTDDTVDGIRPDYSGNSKGMSADIVVLEDKNFGVDAHYVEVKKRQGNAGNRVSVMAGSANEENGMSELHGLVNDTPPWCSTSLAVKFDHRELAVFDAETLLQRLAHDDESFMEPFYPRETPGGNISMVKPELGDWRSSTAGYDDHLKLMKELGVE